MNVAVKSDLTSLTADVLCAYLSNNPLDADDVAPLIRATHAALSAIISPPPAAELPESHAPAVSIRKSLASPEHILSLIDGKPYKTLKRHLASHGLTPAEYRQRYNLPSDYPMVSASYSERRRAVAAELGLGRRTRMGGGDVAPDENEDGAIVVDTVVASAAEISAPAAVSRARKNKAAGSKAGSAAAPAQSTATPRRRLRLKLAADDDGNSA